MLPVNRKADVMLPEELQVKDSAYFESLSNLKTTLTASSSFPNKPGQANGTSHFSSAVPHPSLLVIEDNSDVIQYLTLILQNNYQLLTAANGRLGLEIARKELPDLILCDVMMPEMDGLEVCRQLKNDLSTSHIPIVLLTAKADFDSRLEGLKLGADAYLAKPFEEKELKIVLKKLHENRERLRQFYTSGEFLRKRENTTSEDVQLSARDQEFLQRLVEAVESNLSDPNFTAEILSNLLFVSYNTCLRKVKALVGMNVNEYIHHIRLNKAAQWLLEDPERSVVEIAEAAGYNSHSYFNRVFKHAMGCTPSEYRKA
jgi:YesN/AraC family two-component response regulator